MSGVLACFMTARNIPTNARIATEVCIVGGGPAGITIAMRLMEGGRRVILLGSGGQRETPYARDLNRGRAPVQGHEPLEESRRRQWGGASAVWGGRCIPLDDIDLRNRAWVPQRMAASAGIDKPLLS